MPRIFDDNAIATADVDNLLHERKVHLQNVADVAK
jgi:hypothetical protein